MAIGVSVGPVGVLFLNLLRISEGKAQQQRMGLVFALVLEVRRVYNVILFLLVKNVVKFEDLGANYFVISIQNVENLVVITVFVHSIVSIA